MTIPYVLAIGLHLLAVMFWVGMLFLRGPGKKFFAFSLPEQGLERMGWCAQALLWLTGLFMLYQHGILPQDLLSFDFLVSRWGRLLWYKLLLVLLLLVLQLPVGNKPSELVYGYLILALTIIGLSVLLSRPHLLVAL